VAQHLEREGLARTLPVEVPIELPPVGLISLSGRVRTPTTAQLVDCLREVAQGIAAQDARSRPREGRRVARSAPAPHSRATRQHSRGMEG
jgi:hypothetical protein